MSNVEILTGEAAVSAPNDGFAGMASPRAFRIGESLRNRACDLLEAGFRGRWGADVALAEAFSTSDFKLAAFAELDKEMVQQYDELPFVWNQYTDATTVNDFRPKRLLSRWNSTHGFQRVPELTEYPELGLGDGAEDKIAVFKHGGRYAISWEMWKNNEAIQELEDLPSALARAARETEAVAALSNLLAVDPKTGFASGVNTQFFKAANGNAPTNLPLTIDNLDAVLTGMANKKSVRSGKVVASPPLVVVVPQALKTVADRIKAARYIRRTETVGGVEQTTEYDNYLSSTTFVVDPTLDFLNQGAKAATTWFVLPAPGSRQPASWVARLRGYEAPEIRVKADTGQRVGGGDISALEGSFEIDDIQYRGRHIVGNQTGDPTFTYVSTGS